MLGLECVILPVTAPLVITLPCTLPSSFTASNQLSICATRFWSIRYSAISLASGMSSLDKIPSSTIACPVSVNCLGFHPNSTSFSPICFLDPGLKITTLSAMGLPWVLWKRGVMTGGHLLCICSYIPAIFPLMSVSRQVA